MGSGFFEGAPAIQTLVWVWTNGDNKCIFSTGHHLLLSTDFQQ